MTYKQYLNSDKWKNLRKQVFERANRKAGEQHALGICEECGYKPWKPCLQVHHINYDNVFHEKLSDLILLCPNCHRARHKIKKGQKGAEPIENKERAGVNGNV